MPKRHYHSSSDPILTPQLLKDFFLTKARLASRLTFKEIQTLLDVYPFPGFRKALEPLQLEVSRKHVRIETQMKAELDFNKSSAEVLNVSMHGLLLRTSSATLTDGQTIDMTVWLNESSSTRLKAVVRWCPENGLFGISIINPSEEWLSMVKTLENEYKKFSNVLKAAA